MDTFTDAYVEAMLWAETDDNGTPLDSNYTVRDLSTEAMERIIADCARFLEGNGEAIHATGSLGQAGHDFWLTRNHHGAGFWDGDWPEPQAAVLTNAAHSFGECNLYIGDDGLLYLQ